MTNGIVTRQGRENKPHSCAGINLLISNFSSISLIFFFTIAVQLLPDGDGAKRRHQTQPP